MGNALRNMKMLNLASIMLDFAACVLAAILITIGTPDLAYAYVDPSVMTYAIQAVAGAAVALSAVVGVAFRRTRKWLFKRLGIDPDASRVEDAQWFAFDEPDDTRLELRVDQMDGVKGSQQGAISESRPSRARSQGGWTDYRPSWQRRFALALIVSCMAAGTLLFVAPLEIVAAGGSDFVFSPQDIAPVAAVLTVLTAFISALAVSLFRGKAFAYALATIFALGVGFFVQALFLNGGLPIADGNAVDWSRYTKITVASTVVWVAIMAACAIAVRVANVHSITIAVAFSALLIMMQGAGAISVLFDTSSGTLSDGTPAARKAAVTEEGLFDVGSKNNVIVFVLDTYDTSDFIAASKKDPSITDALTGFTWYDNVCGAMIPTRYGVPFLLTGERPFENETWRTYLKERYNRSPFLSDIAQTGYSAGLYTTHLVTTETSPEIAQEKVIDLTLNVKDKVNADMDTLGTAGVLARMAFYRDLPWVCKAPFWFDTDEVVSGMVEGELDAPEQTIYLRDDAGYYERLKQTHLTVEDRGASGTFRFIHMTGTHTPYVMNAEGVLVGKDNATRVEQAIGSLRIAEYYLQHLKDLGVYDDATIIFTADHGKWYLTDKFLKEPSSPFVLVKPSQSHEEASAPLITSHAPVMHDDVVPTVIDAIGGDSSKYSGKSLFRYTGEEDPNEPRLYLSTQSDGKHDTNIVEYAIEGDVMDLGNWRLTGRSWNARE